MNDYKLQIQNIMNCSVCGRGYSTLDTVPRVLVSCGHTFCSACIKSRLCEQTIECFSCGKISNAVEMNSLPVNEVLLNMIKPQYLCRVHKLKLEALCEKDNQLLCLSCVLSNQHKTHRITSISDKVKEDRKCLKECHAKMQETQQDRAKALTEIEDCIDKTQQEYKDYLLEVTVFFKNIRDEIGIHEQRELQRGKSEMENILRKMSALRLQYTTKQELFLQLYAVYEELQQMSDIEYLNEEHKRMMIVDNCKGKRSKPQADRIQFKRIACLQQILSQLQQIASYERKKSINQGLYTASPMLRKQSSKQPTTLEVNLSEQYNKHKAKRTKPAKSTITIHTQRLLQECVPAGRQKQKSTGKCQEGSIQRQKKGSVLDELDGSQAYTPMSSVNSFMQSSRASVFSAVNQSLLSVSELSVRNSQFTMHDFQEKIYHIGGLSNRTIEVYSLETTKSEITQAEVDRSWFQCVIWKPYSPDKILVLGGQSKSKSSAILQYDFKADCLTKCHDLSFMEIRSGFGLVVHDGLLYLIGGAFNGPTDSVEQYRLNGKAVVIKKMASMAKERNQVGCVLGYDGCIYAAGGVNSSNSVMSSCEKYSISTNQWSPIDSMRHPRRSFLLIATPNGLYAIGGHDGTNYLKEVQYYGYESGKWVQMDSMATARCCMSGVVVNGKQGIMVFGGYKNGGLDSVEMYDVKSNKWRGCGKMMSERFMHCSILPTI